MVRKWLDIDFSVSFGFCIFLAALVLLLPLKLILGWILAVAVHEGCHYAALRICRVPVLKIKFQGLGLQIETGEMTVLQELLCAAAGPLGGMSLLFVSRWMPYSAVCAFCLSMFNLLPIYSLDGGRVLSCVLRRWLGQKQGEQAGNVISMMVMAVIAFFCVCQSVQTGNLLWCLCGLVLVLAGFRAKISLQRNKTNSTIAKTANRRDGYECDAGKNFAPGTKTRPVYRR